MHVYMWHTFFIRFHSFESEVDGVWSSYNQSMQQVLVKKKEKKLNISYVLEQSLPHINSQL